jgi:shikimate kinase
VSEGGEPDACAVRPHHDRVGSSWGEFMAEALSNIVLIGMPGSGKSTVGVLLARLTARRFLDTDMLIRKATGRTLQEIVDTDGYMVLRKIEEGVLVSLDYHDHVIATGGSAVYSQVAMEHLKSDGLIVFLDADLATVESRVHDSATRGLAKRPDQTLADLFAERLPLYTKYADVTVSCGGLTDEEVCSRIVGELRTRKLIRGASPGS